ncbi:MAG: DUF4231 domain-containing protein [Solirubrobacterales bacterium]|nr:DUF4231 domain-containing protein [Solirubrobacterales bacterium]
MTPTVGESDVDPSASSPTRERLEDQIAWYERKSTDAQHTYKGLKVVQLVTTAAVPVVAAVHATAWVIAALGGVVLILEGVQQLGQYQANWLSYRSTCESLKHEKHLYLAEAGPYTDTASASRTLAERVEGLVSQEHAKWASARDECAGTHKEPAGTPGWTASPFKDA